MQGRGRWVVIVALAGLPACQQGSRQGGGAPPAHVGEARHDQVVSADAGAARADGAGASAAAAAGAGAGAAAAAAGAAPPTGEAAAADPGAAGAGEGTPKAVEAAAGPMGSAGPQAGPQAGADAAAAQWGGGPTAAGPMGSPGPLAAAGPSAGEMAELMAAINRKMSHDDGKGCLADLERVRAIDARLMATMGVLEAQCLMLIGECQRGKRMVADYYKDQTNMTEERAMITAESIASMRCRGGDMTERDQLLGALFELTDGAYMNQRTPEFCKQRIETVRRLGPKVKPRGPDDTQVTAGQQALFFTGAACYARAGDCDGAFRSFWHDYPKASLAAIQDPAQTREIVESTFRSGIERCKEAKLPATSPAP